MNKKQYSFPDLQKIFNDNASAIKQATGPLWKEGYLQGMGINVDKKGEPFLNLVGRKGNKIPKGKIPDKAGDLKIKIEYRGTAKLL